ncbi:hypothetical protein [Chitinimonas sp. JJ19]|uniref:hypothetical protein n=1 Tax=Chitinimonas sp. JJ19 TaxID=3109352 RepID=UPI00300230CC
MNRLYAEEIIGCLPEGRTVFNYYPERYAWLLLKHLVGPRVSIAAIKRSAYAGLLQKPRIKQWLAQAGSKQLCAADVLAADGDPAALPFTLSLGLWDGAQTTRGGANLVLQLNFDRGHDATYQRLVRPREHCLPFGTRYHPINRVGRNTLAWSRLDVDMASGEVLIEEVQTDWLRNVAAAALNPKVVWGADASEESIRTYAEFALGRYRKLWAEAMLTATIWFVREELGLRRMFYHSPASCASLKGIRLRQPPRSIYTDLPRQFCFAAGSEAPRFLSKKQAKQACEARLYQLNLETMTP